MQCCSPPVDCWEVRMVNRSIFIIVITGGLVFNYLYQ